MDLMTSDEAVAYGQQMAGGGDPNDTSMPIFFYKPVKNVAATAEKGRDIYNEVAYVTILLPGIKGEEPVHKVSDAEKTRWPQQWAAFLAKEEQPVTGTPIEACSIISKSWCGVLKGKNIKTVEALLNIPDTALTDLGPESVNIQHKVKVWADTNAHARDLEKKLSALENAGQAKEEDTKHTEIENRQLKTSLDKIKEGYAELKLKYDALVDGAGGADLMPLETALVAKGWPIGDDLDVLDAAIMSIRKATKKDLEAIRG